MSVITFGCRLNAYESEVIKQKTIENGLENDIIIINSCAVTSEAEKQLLKEIKRIYKLYPTKKIILTGCAVQINPAKYQSIKEVYSIIGNTEKLKSESYANIAQQKSINMSNIMNENTLKIDTVTQFDGKTRGYVQIQNGCNHRCTFCIIPYGRGNSRSAPFQEIYKQAQQLVEQGYQELVITGVDITDYGSNLPGKPSLGQLIKRLLKHLPTLKRIRLSSIDVAEIDKDLLDLIANEERFMPHLHLSLQSGDDIILKRMKRRHSRNQIYEFCNLASKLRPNIVFGADIIAGFPTESNEMFNNTYNMINEIEKIIHLHVFSYSIREGTPAAKMPQVNNVDKKNRTNQLRKLSNILLNKHLNNQRNTSVKTLIENNNIGRTEDFCIVNTQNLQLQVGVIYQLQIKDIQNNQLIPQDL